MSTFFVPSLPDVPIDDQEELYAELARMAGRAVPDDDRRIFAIDFAHDGVIWTAEVGRRLRGTQTKKVTRGGRRTTVDVPHSSSATVVAIFSGSPHMVVLDTRPLSPRRSEWMNPFLAGDPLRQRYFDT